MHVRAYLNLETKDLPNFKTQKNSNGGERNTFHDVRVYEEKGRFFAEVYDLSDEFPQMIANAIEEVSFRGSRAINARRESGIYRHKTATAEVDVYVAGGSEEGSGHDRNPFHIEFNIRAKNLDDLRELYHMIRAGTIRPEESYDGPQNELSRAELEAGFKEFQSRAYKTAVALEIAECKLEKIGALAASFNGRFPRLWPLCSTKRVWNRLSDILYDRA